MTKIPTSTCKHCGHTASSASFTTLSSAGSSSLLCGKCFNKAVAQAMEVPVPDPAEFAPLTVSVGARRHTFVFHVYLNPGGLGIGAREHEPRDPEGGFEFEVLVPAIIPSKLAYEMLVKKIKKGIRTKSLTSDGSRLKEHVAVGRFRYESLVIDGGEVTWDEFRQILNCYEGWQFRLEVLDPSDDPYRDSLSQQTEPESSDNSTFSTNSSLGRLPPSSFH